MSQPKTTESNPVLAAWREQFVHARANPFLLQLFLKQWQRVLKRLAYFYAQLASLPRRNRRALQRALATSLIGAAMLLALSSAPLVYANAITVDPGASGINNGDGCSLVEAIINANDAAQTYAECVGGSGDDIITLPNGATLTYTVPYGSNAALPNIVNKVVIEASSSTIQRDTVNPVPYFRIFNVLYGADLTLNQATLSGGIEYYGGGILSRGTLTVTNSTITDNDAFCGTNNCYTYGGGIASDGNLNISDSTVSGNTVNCLGDPFCTAYGGGIAHIYGTAILTDSFVTGNSSSMYDGGIHNGGTMTLNNTTVSGNDAVIYAGGIHNENDTLTLNNSTVSYNILTGGTYNVFGGGGIVNNPEATLGIYSSTVSENYGGYAGGGILNGGELTVRDSTISGNSAFLGGGLLNLGGQAGVFTSTIDGGYAFLGGGIFNAYGEVGLGQSTVSGNFAFAAGGIMNGYIEGFFDSGLDGKSGKFQARTAQQTDEIRTRLAKKFPKAKSDFSFTVNRARLRTMFDRAPNQHGAAPDIQPLDLCYEDCDYTAQMLLVNSTISGNEAYAVGGIANITNGALATFNVTIANNSAEAFVGGLGTFDYGTTELHRTLISGNTVGDPDDGVNEILVVEDGTLTADDFNLFGHSGETDAQAFYGFAPGAADFNATSDGSYATPLANILNTTLALNNNANGTFTNALVLGSPAIDKAPSAACALSPTDDVDQRDFPRNVNINNGDANYLCDIGAFELQSTTAVNVTNFIGLVRPDKHVLKWQTTSEAQIAGFNVYRRVGKGQWKQINAKFKQAKYSGDAAGAQYRFADKQVQAGKTHRYKIQVHYLDGHTEWTPVVRTKRK